MKRAELILFFYSMAGLLAFNFVYRSFNERYDICYIDKSIPGVKFSKLYLHNNTVEFKIKKRPGLKTQVILFNSFRPDTFCLKDNKGLFSTNACNAWMVREPSSAKQRSPVYDFTNVFVMAQRHVNTYKHTCGEWTYTTLQQDKNDFYAVSIITSPGNLFDFEKGIYVNGATQLYENSATRFTRPWWLNPGNWGNKGKEWERSTHFQYLDPNGKTVFTANCGIRIHGNATRGFPQKSLRLSADKTYGKKTFNYDFFGNKKQAHKSLVLRNSGNDWGRTMFADYFIQSCIPLEFIDKQLFVPVDVYINGFYWGIYSLCERLDEDYLAKKYNTKKKNITIVEGEVLEYGNEDEKNKYVKLIRECWNDQKSDDKLYSKLEEQIDIDNFASFIAIQIYIVNTDLESPNVKVYRIKDGKWRWIIKDLDCSYSYSGHNSYNTDMFDRLMKSNTTAGVVFKTCMKNMNFQKTLKEKMTFLLDSSFAKDVQLKKLNQFQKKYEKSMKKQISRWRKPISENAWIEYIEEFKNFIELREGKLRKQMEKYFSLA